jgi:hypothetical protein
VNLVAEAGLNVGETRGADAAVDGEYTAGPKERMRPPLLPIKATGCNITSLTREKPRGRTEEILTYCLTGYSDGISTRVFDSPNS